MSKHTTYLRKQTETATRRHRLLVRIIGDPLGSPWKISDYGTTQLQKQIRSHQQAMDEWVQGGFL